MTLPPFAKLSRHRNLYNGDCTFLFCDHDPVSPEAGATFMREVLHRFIRRLAESGVDTYLNNPNGQVPWYPGKALPGVLAGYSRDDREFVRGHFPPSNETDLPRELLESLIDEQLQMLNRYLDLEEAGLDWVQEISKACRYHGVSPWVSIRMNDAHGANRWEASYFNCALQRDAKYRLQARPRTSLDHDPAYMLMNYEHQEVRDYHFAMIRELVEEYDHEGLELDWTRTPACCEPDATPQTCDLMTAWIAQIRELTERQAAKTGKPFAFGLRIPVRLDVLKSIGLDVRAMARQGLLDFICPTNLWQTTWDVPIDRLRRELGEDVRIYGVVEDAPNWMYAHSPRLKRDMYRLLSTSPELLRGNAAGKLVLGAHGIETFNFFCSDTAEHNPDTQTQCAQYPALRGLHDLESLRGQPKHYAFATAVGHWLNSVFEYAEQVPFILEPQWQRTLRLPMCAEPEALTELVVQVVVGNGVEPGAQACPAIPPLAVSFNGSWPNFEAQPTDTLVCPTGDYTHHTGEHTAFNFCFEASRIQEGWNELTIYNGATTDGYQVATPQERRQKSVNVVSVELAVR